jgi:hypothetical protein
MSLRKALSGHVDVTTLCSGTESCEWRSLVEIADCYLKVSPLNSPGVHTSKGASVCLFFLAKWEKECWKAQDIPREKQGPALVCCSQFLSEWIPQPINWLGHNCSQLHVGCCRGHNDCCVCWSTNSPTQAWVWGTMCQHIAFHTIHSFPVITLGYLRPSRPVPPDRKALHWSISI